ncbi:MAG: ATP-dependent helicase HrpB [Chromatiales bacterium]|jgi:ATP-dependent helicase HrpB
MTVDELPVKKAIPALSAALAEHPSAVLCAPPGSGKTTLVPLGLLQDSWLAGRKILLLEPRRLAARAAASRMASLLGEKVGQRVGYAIRLERRVCADTRIEVVTEGILTRRLQEQPELADIGLVIFDEFHERNLQTDLGLALALDVQQGLREDLRLLVMSATLDSEEVSELLQGAPVIEAQGRSYPVTLYYLGQTPDRRRIAEQTAAASLQAYREQQGDLLVFLPGMREIRETASLLSRRLEGQPQPPLLAPLYGDLPKMEQDRALSPDPRGRRRIVLTTSIAETSLTIEGVTTVVDSGWSRLPQFLPGLGLTRLETLPVSQAAAAQRAGRAGRLGPGFCYRLWPESQQPRLPAVHPAEIRQADLAPLVLELMRWGVSDAAQLRWPEPPPKPAYEQAQELLQRLGALDSQYRLTSLGRDMARLPLHPRLAHMLLRSGEGQRRQVCDLAALLSERDILLRNDGGAGSVDVGLRLRLLQAWREQRGNAQAASLNPAACRQIDRLSRDWSKRLQVVTQIESYSDLSLAQSLALAYPDRIAQQTGHARFRLVSGRAVRLVENDPLATAEFLVAAQLDAGAKEGRVRLAAVIALQELRDLPDLRIERQAQVYWDSAARRVRAQKVESLGAVVLSRQPLQDADPQALRGALLQGIAEQGLGALPWSKGLRSWQARLCWLRAALAEGGLPDLSDRWLQSHLEEWLGPWLEGMTQLTQLQRLDLDTILRSRLNWEQQQLIEQEAPSHLQVPSGSRIPLIYTPGKAPILAVRLQELFGLAETPRVGRGRVPVMLHLLSPARRPMQITDDLGGFWRRTYPEVKKELKGRYPKHYWPDDPLQAVATARAKPRR